MAIASSTGPRTRRAVLLGALGGLGVLAARSLGSADPTDAAGAVQLGVGNSETSITSIRNTSGSASAIALTGSSTAAGATGLQGVATGSNGKGVYGYAPTGSTAMGVYGAAAQGHGVQGYGVIGVVGNGTTWGVYGNTGVTNGIGVNATAVNGAGVQASGGPIGVDATATASTGIAVKATAMGVSAYAVKADGGYYGVYGSGDTYAVYGTSGYTGVYGVGAEYGVVGNGNSYGVYGSGGSYGGYFLGGPTGVYGNGSTTGVVGAGNSEGVAGYSVVGVHGHGGQIGVYGTDATNSGVQGISTYVGVWGAGTSWGVYAEATGTSGQIYGVYGKSDSAGGYGLFSQGDAHVNGTLSKTAGAFKIDHPLDPENKWLSHSFVESPDMMNVYNGNVVLDARGQAMVQLPRYFTTLNRDYRYQLTPIGEFAPVYVAAKIAGGRFRIAGGKAGLEVSWQVTGIRQDDYALAHPIVVETRKTKAERGTRSFVPAGSITKEWAAAPQAVRPPHVAAPPKPHRLQHQER
jgi:hypothetical protein